MGGMTAAGPNTTGGTTGIAAADAATIAARAVSILQSG